MPERPEDLAEYETLLRDWEQTGFIQPGWSIHYDAGEGAYVMTFWLSSRTMYSLTEANMDYYIIGVSDMAHFRSGRKKDGE